ncbi:MAG: PaaI family thioesterase [Phycisphaerae bacterium]|nr:PaaI family thioesterase [Phycisphaerae bacterium]
MATLGAELLEVACGRVCIGLRPGVPVSQQDGLVHAGAIAAIADSACGYAALTRMPEGSRVLSVEFKLNLLAPAVGERVEARAEVKRSGRTLSVVTADVFAVSSGREVLVAAMLSTMIRVRSVTGEG